jgi:hypothetical protein
MPRDKITTDVRQHIAAIVKDNIPQLQADIQALPTFQRVRAILELMSYVIPRYAPLQTEQDEDKQSFNITLDLEPPKH